MQIIKIDSKNPDKKVAAQAIQSLKKDGILVYPTETAYGLGADATSKKAVQKIYKIKGRKYNKPLPLIVTHLAMAKKYVRFDKKSLQLAKKYWPGALSIKLKMKNEKLKISIKNLKFFDNTLVLRVSSNKVAQALSKKLGKPITATSANISGKKECYEIKDLLKQFKNRKFKPDLILDAGKLKKVKPSTIIEVVGSRIKILRQGSIEI